MRKGSIARMARIGPFSGVYAYVFASATAIEDSHAAEAEEVAPLGSRNTVARNLESTSGVDLASASRKCGIALTFIRRTVGK